MNIRKRLKIAPRALSCRLMGRGARLMLAESFTGGLISSSITMIAGASDYLFEGVVCYNSKSKTRRLGVSESDIDEYGAASCAVARQMLCGLLEAGADIAIATTGNAGPTSQGGDAGVCYVGCATKSTMVIKKVFISGGRQKVIKKGAALAMELAVQLFDEPT